MESLIEVPLHETTQERYLNYAMSVITSRALPDVRDGLKPVQRRILFGMYNDLHLGPDKKYRKSALVVGDVMGKYHPHGDSSIYDALVRMAQDFSMRAMLVDGQGNFGSIDGDGSAAMRYTEVRLQAYAISLLKELSQDTVGFRDNYDGSRSEPVVLPAQIPNLLANGSTGIAVGMATNIPPHNLTELVNACVALIDDHTLENKQLMKYVKGPDFPTGGNILNDKKEIQNIYETGSGAVIVQASYKIEEGAKKGTEAIIVTELPYQVNKSNLIANIGDLIATKKLSLAVDIRDESTTDIRVVIDLKKEADPEMVMTYLFKHTDLQTRFNINMTCLTPTAGSEIPVPQRLGLAEILNYFIEFRMEVVTRRFEYELKKLRERIHILEGFRKIFNALDRAIKIIRASKGKQDAADKLITAFKIDSIQADAVLETKLYKLAKLEIKKILDELREKKAEADRIEGILKSKSRRWTIIKKELLAVAAEHADKRRTIIKGKGIETAEFDAEDYIVSEDTNIVITTANMVRRIRSISDVAKIPMRGDDTIMRIVQGNTKSSIVLFSSFGTAYTTRFYDIPDARGYGSPVSSLFKLKDGERIIAALSLDERLVEAAHITPESDEDIPLVHAFALTEQGNGIRFSLHTYAEPSTKSGRRYGKAGNEDRFVDAQLCNGEENLICITRKGKWLAFPANEINFVVSPGKGMRCMKLAKEDAMLGFRLAESHLDTLTASTEAGRVVEIKVTKSKLSTRGGAGSKSISRGELISIADTDDEYISLADLLAEEES